MRGAHLGQHLVQPLQRPVQVDLDPAGRARDILAVVLGAPALQGKSSGSDWTAACGGLADTPSLPPRAAPGTRGPQAPSLDVQGNFCINQTRELSLNQRLSVHS